MNPLPVSVYIVNMDGIMINFVHSKYRWVVNLADWSHYGGDKIWCCSQPTILVKSHY